MRWLPLLLTACTGEPSIPVDADRDGFPAGQDCDDADADAFPGAAEFCNGVDDDCDGEVDDGPPWDARTWYVDADGDGVGCDGCAVVVACDAPEGFVRDAGDCDDTDPERRPLHFESCNGIDDDCDGLVDVDTDELWYTDADGDGFGDPSTAVGTCAPSASQVALAFDCDDGDPLVHPDAPERCTGHDDDCDGLVDDEDTVPEPTVWYPDQDADGFGTTGFTVTVCTPPQGAWSTTDDDCDDTSAEVYPGALERCDGRDEDCDGAVDGPEAPLVGGPRVPVALDAPQGVRSAPMLAPVDLAGLGGTDGDAVRLAFGDCATGLAEVPARFLDGWDAFGVPGVDGDGLGVLIAVWDTDGDGSTAEVLPAGAQAGWLYLDAPGGPGDASASATALAGDLGVLALDGLAAASLDAGAGSVFDQTGWGPRVDTPSGSLVLPGATVGVVDDHHALAGVSGAIDVSGPSGTVRFDVAWWRTAARPEVWVRVESTALTDVLVQGAPFWQAGSVLFAGAIPADVEVLGDTALGASLGVRVLDAPVLSGLQRSGDALVLAGSDLTAPLTGVATLPAGTRLGATTVVLVPAADPSERLAELDAGVTLVVGP